MFNIYRNLKLKDLEEKKKMHRNLISFLHNKIFFFPSITS
jgi:hypothetical protein